MTTRTGQQLTLQEAAKKAGCHTETIRRAIVRKELLAQKHPTAKGAPYLIYAVDLGAWLESRRAT